MFTRDEPPKPHKLMTRVRARIGEGLRITDVEGTIRARWYATDGSGWHYAVKSDWMKVTHLDVPHARLTVLSAPVIAFDPKTRATPRVPGARYATAIARPA